MLLRGNRVQRGLALLGVLALVFVPGLSSAASLTSRSDRMSTQAVSTASDHTIKFTTPTGVDASTDTITLTFPSGFTLSSIVAADIALSHGATTGLETSETIASSAAAGTWGASVSSQTITLAAPTDAAAGEISATQVVVIKIGTNAGGTHQITNPSAAGTYTLAIAGTFGDLGGVSLPIVSSNTVSVSATVAGGQQGNPGGAGAGQAGPAPDGTPPVISNVVATQIGDTGATIVWTTDENADSKVDYGTTNAYELGFTANGAQVLSHSVVLAGLTPDTEYHFRVTSKDPVGNGANSGDYTFRTTIPKPPVLSNTEAVNITDKSAVIKWNTDVAADGLVEYGTTDQYGASASQDQLLQEHIIPLTRLKANTPYHFRVTSKGANGLLTRSNDFMFMTRPDQTPPTNVSDLRLVPGNALIDLGWKNPSDEDFARVIVRARTDRSPQSATDGRLVYQGNGTKVQDKGLINGTRYYYAVFAVDQSGNAASGALKDGAPNGPVAKPEPEKPEPEPQQDQPPKPQPPPPPAGGTAEPQPGQQPQQPPGGGGDTTTSTPGTQPEVSTSTIDQPEPVTQPEDQAPSESGPSTELQPLFFSAGGALALSANQSGRIPVVSGKTILLQVPVTTLGVLPQDGRVVVGNDVYRLSAQGDVWATSFAAPSGESAVKIVLVLRSGEELISERLLVSQSYGRVREDILLGASNQPVEKAEVKLLTTSGKLWDGSFFGQPNPIRSAADGTYGFSVPNGTYRLVVSKDGYKNWEREVNVRGYWLSMNVDLAKKPSLEALDASKPLLENAKVIAEQIAPALQVGLQTVQSPEAQTVTKAVVVPTVVTVAAANTGTAVSAFSIVNYLHYLLTQPLLLIRRRKRQKWGVIYNALTKLPVDLAVVRLIHAEKNLVVQTRITDSQGRFAFQVQPGQYRLEVVKPGYQYPTQLLKDKKVDVDYLDLYHGEPVEVRAGSSISVNVPLDPTAKEQPPAQVMRKKIWRRVQSGLSWGSVVLTAASLISVPSWWMVGVLTLQVGFTFLFRRLALAPKPKSWGVIYDETTGQKIERAIIRIFDKQFNKLLETQVTGKDGKYGFIVGKNIYYLTAEGLGYERFISPDLDLTNKAAGVIDQKIALKKNP